MLIFKVALALIASQNAVPRAEHPRPDLRRTEWTSLNGTWDFAETDDVHDLSWLKNSEFPDKITVPFCRESELSGLKRTGFVKNVWYRKTFAKPDWRSPRVVLHIGACDWQTTVWINGRKVGDHVGGSSPIDIDITNALWSEKNTVIIRAFDDTKSGLQALGKQCTEENSFGCLYTRTTGIWQSVWLEGVGSSYFSRVSLDGSANGRLKIDARVLGSDVNFVAKYEVSDRGKMIASGTFSPSSDFVTKIQAVKVWAPGSPNLYDVKVSLYSSDKLVDVVNTYVGFRKIKIDGRRILINGKPVFQRLVLDQGFYPKGVWTAPSDADLKRDIELSMAAGFNGARLHQKVFEPRFLYWADKMGYLVWGEYPNWGLDYRKPINSPVLNEWSEIVLRDRSHPSIVGWCPFNETPNEAGQIQRVVVDATRKLDRTRPIIDTSGYIHSVLNPLVMDAHDYDQNPVSFKNRYINYFGESALPARYRDVSAGNIPFMVSEFGGIGWDTTGGWGYGEGPKSLPEFYKRFEGLCDALLSNPNMFGYCYTQLTDVEQEKNGIYKYDRSPKFDLKLLHAVQTKKAAVEGNFVRPTATTKDNWKVLVGSGRDANPKPWMMTENQPPDTWFSTSFDDKTWTKAKGAFADSGSSRNGVNTPWRSKDIWLRQRFDWNGKAFRSAILAMHYDNQATIYLNGKLLWMAKAGTWNDAYEPFDVTKKAKELLRKGSNQLAVHCHQDTGGQYIDLAFLAR